MEKVIQVTLEVWRQPGPKAKGRFERHKTTVSTDASFLEMLDGVNEGLIAQGKEPIAFEHDCREGICGSCGFMINGQAHGPDRGTTVCQLHMRRFRDKAHLVLEPWRAKAFPVVRDLVIDLDGFLEKLKSVKPFILRAKELAVEAGPARQSPEQLEEFKQFSMCINCMLCYAACPVVANEPDFLGPAAIALGHRYNQDSRDHGAVERNEVFREDGGVFACSFANECTEVCPKHVDPAAAIQQEKLLAAQDWVASLLPGRG